MSAERELVIKKHSDLYRSYLFLLKELGPEKANAISKKQLFKMAAERPAPSFYMQAEAAGKSIRSILANTDERRKIERDIDRERQEVGEIY
jgi:hypothetical protein